MSPTWIITKRELKANFDTPVAYIVLCLTLPAVAFNFFLNKDLGFFDINRASMTWLIENVSVLVVILATVLTMRVMADERRTGTLEMLITQPVRDWEVILGKYLGAVGLLMVLIISTFSYPIFISRMGELDWGPVYGGYLGLLLGGASYVAFGVMVSSYTKDQITAFFVSFIVGSLFFLLNKALIFFGSAASWLEYLCPDYHFTNISRGIIDARDLVYFFSVIFVSLLATERSLSSRKWS